MNRFLEAKNVIFNTTKILYSLFPRQQHLNISKLKNSMRPANDLINFARNI